MLLTLYISIIAVVVCSSPTTFTPLRKLLLQPLAKNIVMVDKMGRLIKATSPMGLSAVGEEHWTAAWVLNVPLCDYIWNTNKGGNGEISINNVRKAIINQPFFKYIYGSIKQIVMGNLKGEFHYTKTLTPAGLITGNIVGEYRNNGADGTKNYREWRTESGDIDNPTGLPPMNFEGTYYSSCFHNQQASAYILEIEKVGTKFKLTWNRPRAGTPAFKGEGEIINGVLQGTYENID